MPRANSSGVPSRLWICCISAMVRARCGASVTSVDIVLPLVNGFGDRAGPGPAGDLPGAVALAKSHGDLGRLDRASAVLAVGERHGHHGITGVAVDLRPDEVAHRDLLIRLPVGLAVLGEVAEPGLEGARPAPRSEERRVGKECRSRWS